MNQETPRQDRAIDTLQRLLAIEPTDLEAAMMQAAQLVAETLEADKVDTFLYDPDIDSLVAAGTSQTDMGRKQKALGLDRLPISNGGRAVQVFQSRTSHICGHVEEDPEELPGVKQGLGVRSNLVAPLEIAGEVRGALLVTSERPDFYSEDDLHFLEAVSKWVGLVAQRAELVERLTRQAAEDARRNAAEELMTVLAHDLRNLLAPIKGRVDLIQRRAVREGKEQDLRDALEASRSLDRINRLISDMMDAARLDQGLFSIYPQLTDLVGVVQATVEGLRSPDKRIRLEAPAELHASLDPERFRQALENLLSNATQHSPEGTEVLVQVETVTENDCERALVSVTDQGSGILPERQAKLFDRFVTGNGSSGLGLGLYLANGIVGAHGGKLTVDSVPGRTRFTISLPLEP